MTQDSMIELPPESGEMSLIDHLKELRNRAMISMAALVVAVIVSFIFWRDIAEILIGPAKDHDPDFRLATFAATEAFFLSMKLSMYSGIVVASPVIIYEILMFVLPGLTAKEKKLIFPSMFGVVFFLLLGIAFAYYVILPASLGFLLDFGGDDFQEIIQARAVLQFHHATDPAGRHLIRNADGYRLACSPRCGDCAKGPRVLALHGRDHFHYRCRCDSHPGSDYPDVRGRSARCALPGRDWPRLPRPTQEAKRRRRVRSGASSRATMIGIGGIGGFFSGLVGGGGGAIMIPLMTGVLKIRQHAAHGTSLVIIAGAATAASATYIAQGNVRWVLVGFMLLGSTAGAWIGARGAMHLPAMRLRQALAVFLVLVALRLILVRNVDPLFSSPPAAQEAGIAAMIGLFGGLASGALGVGGGAIFVPALVLLLGVGQHVAQGVSLCVIVFTAIVGATTHHRQGTVDVLAAKWITPIAVPAGVLGSIFAAQMSDRALRVTVSSVILCIGIQMFLTATRRIRKDREELAVASNPPVQAGEGAPN